MIFDVLNPRDYLDLLIEDYWEFFPRNRTSPKHAMRVALFAHHLHEFVWHFYADSDPAKVYNTKNPDEYKKHLITKCPEFEVVSELCNYAKHARLTRLGKGGVPTPRPTAAGAPEIREVTDRIECTFTNVVAVVGGKPVYGADEPKAFFVDLPSGDEARVDELFRAVYNFWLAEFEIAGL